MNCRRRKPAARRKPRWRYRSAETGRFISKAQWERLPKGETVRERVPPAKRTGQP